MSGFWFGIFRTDKNWRKTPTKIADNWYTVSGEKVEHPDKYFKTIQKRGRKWNGDTGWKKSR